MRSSTVCRIECSASPPRVASFVASRRVSSDPSHAGRWSDGPSSIPGCTRPRSRRRAGSEFPERGHLRKGQRTALSTPLLGEGEVIGALSVFRDQARPFADGQIELLETFADQAVIAIENARLFAELEQRNTELRRATARSPRRWSSRRRLPRCCGSSRPRRPIYSGARRGGSVGDAPLRAPVAAVIWRATAMRCVAAGGTTLRRGDRLADPAIARRDRCRRAHLDRRTSPPARIVGRCREDVSASRACLERSG